MKDWHSRLREGDPGADAVMSAGDVRRIRAAVIAAARQAQVRQPLLWPRAFVVTAAALIMVCGSMLTMLQRTTRQIDNPVDAVLKVAANTAEDVADVSSGERQQLHFRTPGGTRIIWVFDSEFEVKGTLP
jgi:hypothetical protein